MKYLKKSSLRLGTRKSKLAQIQTHMVKEALEKMSIPTSIIAIESEGDKDKEIPLFESQSIGVFTKRLENALLENEIDLAIHSLKDLPTMSSDLLCVFATLRREKAFESLIFLRGVEHSKYPLNLPPGSMIGTSSLRREALLLRERQDLKIVPIRGNVPTRIQAVRDKKVTAVLLAHAGIERLQENLDGLIKLDLPEERFVPAPGQGAIVVQGRIDLPKDLKSAISSLNDTTTEFETRVERKVLGNLQGGCSLPLGVRCSLSSSLFKLNAFLGVYQNDATGNRLWKSFHSFERCSRDEAMLVKETTEFFNKIRHL